MNSKARSELTIASCNKKSNRNIKKRVILNVGGIRHEVMWKTLNTLPDSRLGRIGRAGSLGEVKRLCDDVNLQ